MDSKATLKTMKIATKILEANKNKNKNKDLLEYDKDEEIIKAIEEIGR